MLPTRQPCCDRQSFQPIASGHPLPVNRWSLLVQQRTLVLTGSRGPRGLLYTTSQLPTLTKRPPLLSRLAASFAPLPKKHTLPLPAQAPWSHTLLMGLTTSGMRGVGCTELRSLPSRGCSPLNDWLGVHRTATPMLMVICSLCPVCAPGKGPQRLAAQAGTSQPPGARRLHSCGLPSHLTASNLLPRVFRPHAVL